METKKVIEQGKGYLDIQHLTKTISVYQRFGLNPNGVLILIDKPKAREVALAICPELESELAEKDKVIERLKRRKLVHQLFIGKVADILSVEKAQELLRESNESLNKMI